MRTLARLSAGAVATFILAGCTQGVFSDGEPMQPTAPPSPRNDCEVAFSTNLTNGLGVPEEAPPWPSSEQLAPVLEACSADELLAADAYFTFPAGQPMSYLLHRRLFDGPARAGQLAGRCATDTVWTSSHVCQTLDS